MKKIVVTLICLVIFMGAVGTVLAGRHSGSFLGDGEFTATEKLDCGEGEISQPDFEFLGLYIA